MSPAMGLGHEQLIVGLLLALLAFTGVTCTLSTLAARIRGQKLRHNLVRDSRRRRHDYLAARAAEGAGAGEFDVVEPDVVEPDVPAPALAPAPDTADAPAAPEVERRAA